MFQNHLTQRARLFHHALVSLYVSVGVFVLGSLIGALLDMAGQPSGGSCSGNNKTLIERALPYIQA